MTISKIKVSEKFDNIKAQKALRFYARSLFTGEISRKNPGYRILKGRLLELGSNIDIKKLILFLINSIIIDKDGYISLDNTRIYDKTADCWYRAIKYGSLTAMHNNLLEDSIIKAATLVQQRRIGNGN